MGPDHAPLSKRHGATSVAEFRDKGYLPEALVNYLALIGWSPRRTKFKSQSSPVEGEPGAEELLPALELARRFRLENVSHSAGVFDEDKLSWVNRHYLKALRAGATDRGGAAVPAPGSPRRGRPHRARAGLVGVGPPAGMAASVDRLAQLADRLDSIFHSMLQRCSRLPDWPPNSANQRPVRWFSPWPTISIQRRRS